MKTTWILVADAGRARVISTVDGAKPLSVVQELEHPAGRMRTQQLVSDESGRLNKSGSGVMSAMDPQTDPHEEQAKHFAATLANLLDKGLAGKSYDSLTLVAPAHFLGLLKASLSIQCGKKLHAGIAKDLSRLPMNQLQEHLQQIIG